MSHEQNNIVIGGEGLCVSCKREYSESIVFFHSFLQVLQGLLVTIVYSIGSPSYAICLQLYCCSPYAILKIMVMMFFLALRSFVKFLRIVIVLQCSRSLAVSISHHS